MKKGERKLIVPKIKTSFPVFSFLSEDLDLHFYRKEKYPLLVPKIKLSNPTIIFSESKLDTDYPQVEKRTTTVPKIMFQEPVIIFETTSLDISSILPTQGTLLRKYAYSEEAKLEEVKVKLEDQELQDPLKFLGMTVEEIEPVVILFKDSPHDSCIHTFETLLLRLYREKRGGSPEFKKLSLREDWNKREIEQWLDEGKVFLIDLDSEAKIDIDKNLLADRLWAIFSKGRGIIIFYTKNEKIFNEYNEILDEICWKLQLKPKFIKIRPRDLSSEEKIKLASLLFTDIKDEELLPDSTDGIINISKRKYEEKLREIEKKYDLIGLINRTNDESEEHYRGKAFIVNVLIKRLQESGRIPKRFEEIPWDDIEKLIRTEEPLGEVKPDVVFENEYYEFETLFGEGGFRKITERTLKKYHEELKGVKVKVVVEPITAFLHAKEFRKLIDLIRRGKRFKNIEVEFYTIDAKNERLLPIEEYLRQLKEFQNLSHNLL